MDHVASEVRALAFDRQAVQKQDFPVTRRGYEPAAVDAHLRALAADVERLQRELDAAQRGATGAPAAAAGSPTLAVAASEQVRAIVEAAESSATEIERSAGERAARIRADADGEARRVRGEAVERSQSHVERVETATSGMLQRVDQMQDELGALLAGLRAGTQRLTADLSLLQGDLGDLHGAPSATGVASDGPQRPAEAPAASVSDAAREPEGSAPEAEPAPASAMAAAAEEPAAPPAPAASRGSQRAGGDVDGARLIALNMALNGQSRTETDQYLSENFDLSDRSTLLDEVYATVEG